MTSFERVCFVAGMLCTMIGGTICILGSLACLMFGVQTEAPMAVGTLIAMCGLPFAGGLCCVVVRDVIRGDL